MSSDSSAQQPQEALETISWATLLAERPPGRAYVLAETVQIVVAGQIQVPTTDIELLCDTETCKGIRMFRGSAFAITLRADESEFRFVTYRCKNCEQTTKTYAIFLFVPRERVRAICMKLGEMPQYAPKIPSRVITLIGPDRDLFLQGRRAESLGLGVGAFAYYRRVVNNQKGRLLQQIIAAAERLGAGEGQLATLRAAQNEDQFSKTLEIMGPAVPESIRIKGQNPLQLLYPALSEGIHEHTDAECLELAMDIRAVLTALADKLDQALRDQAELDTAVSRLLQRNSKRGAKEKA